MHASCVCTSARILAYANWWPAWHQVPSRSAMNAGTPWNCKRGCTASRPLTRWPSHGTSQSSPAVRTGASNRSPSLSTVMPSSWDGCRVRRGHAGFTAARHESWPDQACARFASPPRGSRVSAPGNNRDRPRPRPMTGSAAWSWSSCLVAIGSAVRCTSARWPISPRRSPPAEIGRPFRRSGPTRSTAPASWPGSGRPPLATSPAARGSVPGGRHGWCPAGAALRR